MPTASERARIEAEGWVDLAGHWTSEKPTEFNVVVFHDPSDDLKRRAAAWGHQLPSVDLSALSLFAAALATMEAEAWEEETLDLATRAYEARRFLLSDRIIHWAVPWLIAVGADDDLRFLLDLGDEMRVAPRLPGAEGLVGAGEDSYGPLEVNATTESLLTSLWSGIVLMHLLPSSDMADPIEGNASPTTTTPVEFDGNAAEGSLIEVYGAAAARWSDLAAKHPGTAQLWLDLAKRAIASRDLLLGEVQDKSV